MPALELVLVPYFVEEERISDVRVRRYVTLRTYALNFNNSDIRCNAYFDQEPFTAPDDAVIHVTHVGISYIGVAAGVFVASHLSTRYFGAAYQYVGLDTFTTVSSSDAYTVFNGDMVFNREEPGAATHKPMLKILPVGYNAADDIDITVQCYYDVLAPDSGESRLVTLDGYKSLRKRF